MKRIPLTQGKFALVDDDDFDWLNQWKWCAIHTTNNFYAVRNDSTRMHKVILGLKKNDGKMSDHRDGDGLNNRRYNLRKCTHKENTQNRSTHRTNACGYKGVCWKRSRNRWIAYIRYNGRYIHLGSFTCLIKAAKTYDKAAIRYFGGFARTNFPVEGGVL